MGKYDAVISQAKVALTDISVGAFNASNRECNLKLRKTTEFLYEAVSELEKLKNGSFFSKIKDIMFDTDEDAKNDALAADSADAARQLSYCARCRCASCLIVDERRCLCEGCLFGAYVVKCPGGDGVETRKVAPNTVNVNGDQAVTLERDRKTDRDAVIVKNKNGVERRLSIDLKTGFTDEL
jgi:hypothetical protein